MNFTWTKKLWIKFQISYPSPLKKQRGRKQKKTTTIFFWTILYWNSETIFRGITKQTKREVVKETICLMDNNEIAKY